MVTNFKVCYLMQGSNVLSFDGPFLGLFRQRLKLSETRLKKTFRDKLVNVHE